jgi:putative pyruvate formate lyase activating enzyme
MDGVVDVYMPDFKLCSSELARRHLAKRDYPEVARHKPARDAPAGRRTGARRARHARRGLIVRHLVMPGLLPETEGILRFVAEELGSTTFVNVMAQYYLAGRTGEFPEIDRHLYRSEFAHARAGQRARPARARRAQPHGTPRSPPARRADLRTTPYATRAKRFTRYS